MTQQHERYEPYENQPIELARVRGSVDVLGEQINGERALEHQRWSDHEAVHSKDGEALDKALVRTETAIDAASSAHRREHEIEKSAKEAADAAHQQQHVALNELRDIVGDLTGQYVRNDTLSATNDNWERRFGEQTKQFQEYRDAISKEQASFREGLAKSEADYRAQQSIEIRSLRESRSAGLGVKERGAEAWAYMVGGGGLLFGFGGLLIVVIRLATGH